MRPERIQELRILAHKHRDTHRSAKMILELCDALEKTNHLYALALQFGWSDQKSKAIAFSKLKALVEKE